ncbi:hypothetical protein [Clostridium tetani]|uniref:hypothetical protein n=1 Tax=Clostridium tetani TaxID=1513 RepID=UPI002954587B|nr:hypothetical protein [Clostridium tetani]BDR65721.1 hypothetical protein K134307016_p10320 [Clostridium tetani]
MFISLCLILYIINTNYSKHDTTVDLKGSNGLWNVSLNIHFKYDSQLIIEPMRDDFKIPSEISIDIIVNNKRAYADRLKYIPNSNEKFLGKYMVNFSDDYFKKDIKYATIIIRFNNKSNSVFLS